MLEVESNCSLGNEELFAVFITGTHVIFTAKRLDIEAYRVPTSDLTILFGIAHTVCVFT